LKTAFIGYFFLEEIMEEQAEGLTEMVGSVDSQLKELFDDLAADCHRLGRTLRRYDSTRSAQANVAV
jgi:hypothetical protein